MPSFAGFLCGARVGTPSMRPPEAVVQHLLRKTGEGLSSASRAIEQANPKPKPKPNPNPNPSANPNANPNPSRNPNPNPNSNQAVDDASAAATLLVDDIGLRAQEHARRGAADSSTVLSQQPVTAFVRFRPAPAEGTRVRHTATDVEIAPEHAVRVRVRVGLGLGLGLGLGFGLGLGVRVRVRVRVRVQPEP